MTEGQKDDVRLQIGLVANMDGSVETFVTYVGVGTNVLVEGEGAMMVAQAVRVYNEAVETFTGQGFQGMELIPVEYSLEIVEAVAYVRLTGEEPDLDDKFRLSMTRRFSMRAVADTSRATTQQKSPMYFRPSGFPERRSSTSAKAATCSGG
jgi:hypothetical protein